MLRSNWNFKIDETKKKIYFAMLTMPFLVSAFRILRKLDYIITARFMYVVLKV